MSLELALALSRIGRPRVLVVGDFIADIEIECETERFAQEAAHSPVWKWQPSQTKAKIGGAGAVAEMATALGADAFFVTDQTGCATKARYFVNGVQQVRIDCDAKPLSAEQTDRLAAHVADEVQRADCVLIADYGKGVCSEPVLRAAIDGAKKLVDAGKKLCLPVIADPHEKRAWRQFEGVTAMKCNERQWGNAVPSGAWPWQNRLVVTAGAKGCVYSENGRCTSDAIDIPSRARQVVDVTGAGDMVLAAIGVCIAGGMSWPDACRVANSAAGLKVERRGAVPVPNCEVIADLLDGYTIIPSELLPAVSDACRARGGKVVWTNGCFDGGLHAGHIHLLTEARKQGDLLIVGVNTDESVNYLKGPGRPIRRWDERSAVVGALACVDYVVQIGSQGDLQHCIEAVKPDVLAIGSDYRGKPIVGAEHAGRIHYVERLPGVSTSEIIRCSTPRASLSPSPP